MNFAKKRIFTLIITVTLWLSLSGYLFPAIMHNGAGTAYDETGSKQSISLNSIENLIVTAAGYYLNAEAHIQKLLVIFELQNTQGFNSATLDPVINTTLANLLKARDTYQQITYQATTTPYNISMQKVLKSFAFDALCRNEGLNRTVFTLVSKSLKKGDVTSLFKRNVQQLNEMIRLMKQIKKDFAAGKVPQTNLLWKLNEISADTSLFGSYTAMIFARIK